MIRRPPRSTPFPTRRSSDLLRGVADQSRDAVRRAGRLVDLGQQYRQRLQVAHASAAVLRLLDRSEEHTSELQSRQYLVCRLLLEEKEYRKGHCMVLLSETES